MATTIQRLDIFISSPGDVSPEREIVLRVIEKLNRLSYIRAKYLLNPLIYEGEVPPAIGMPAQTVVDTYMTEAKDSYLVVCILWTRMGTPFTHPVTNKEWISGTAYEFTTSYESKRERGTPQILLYRKTADNPDADPIQAERVNNFFDQFKGDDKTFEGLYKRYQDLDEFESMMFEHIERIVNEHPPTAAQVATEIAYLPEIVEEARRLDAAMPSVVTKGSPTEVRAMLVMPDSEGLRALLPDTTEGGEVITKKDIRAGSLSVAYPIDPDTNEPDPIGVTVSIRGGDFDIDEVEQRILLHMGRDSGQLTFTLIPTQTRKISIVHVTVRAQSPDGYEVTLGSASLRTEIQGAGVKVLAQAVWSVLSLPLSARTSSVIKPGAQTFLPPVPKKIAPPPEPEDDIMFGDVGEAPALDDTDTQGSVVDWTGDDEVATEEDEPLKASPYDTREVPALEEEPIFEEPEPTVVLERQEESAVTGGFDADTYGDMQPELSRAKETRPAPPPPQASAPIPTVPVAVPTQQRTGRLAVIALVGLMLITMIILGMLAFSAQQANSEIITSTAVAATVTAEAGVP